MKIVKVTYATTPEFAAQNKVNISKVMGDLRNLKRAGINYNACLSADGKTFVHTAYFASEEDQHMLNNLASFIAFQQQLKASGLEVLPKQELLSLVGSSVDIFN